MFIKNSEKQVTKTFKYYSKESKNCFCFKNALNYKVLCIADEGTNKCRRRAGEQKIVSKMMEGKRIISIILIANLLQAKCVRERHTFFEVVITDGENRIFPPDEALKISDEGGM